MDKSLHFSFFAKKQRKFQNLCKESEGIVKEKKMKILTVFKFKLKDLWPHQLCNKITKETILFHWRNEKYFSILLIYHLFGYNLAKFNAKLSSTIMLIDFWPNCNQTADR